jgi:hypothetical protein
MWEMCHKYFNSWNLVCSFILPFIRDTAKNRGSKIQKKKQIKISDFLHFLFDLMEMQRAPFSRTHEKGEMSKSTTLAQSDVFVFNYIYF